MKQYLLILIVGTMGMLLFGCGTFTLKDENGEETTVDVSNAKDGKVSINDKEGGSIDIDSDEKGNTKMKMKTNEGEFSSESGEDTELPDGFPEEFPIPESAEITMVNTITEDDATVYSVHFSFTDDSESLYDAVKDYADIRGLEIQLDNKTERDGNKSYMLSANNSDDEDSEYFTVNIGQFEAQTGTVTYGVSKK
ncbi:hypothetical protein JNUCC1_02005 [Lentibacillus sp. JNUCC-1]|uniref:hypothetical protein n=1 Tax=Lentibacillus sp. JNUCC-1 TaxID=2654513 RepID=UPI0012E868C3|nr:hypothetical protein [Lentibacillus sp. JNUCC-1]MUV38174.1 hypothetical protein [Lentibacillus sp. JNUCC-1]